MPKSRILLKNVGKTTQGLISALVLVAVSVKVCLNALFASFTFAVSLSQITTRF
jgi:multisubunit Na+/H+ antiporter MnhC subunit